MYSPPSASTAVRRRAPSALPSRLRLLRLALGHGLADGTRLLVARLLLALTLVLAQGGALSHAIGHLADAAGTRQGQDTSLRDDDGPADLAGVCAECLALGGIDLPLGESRGHAPFAAPHFAPLATHAATPVPTAALRPHCRAPPTLA